MLIAEDCSGGTTRPEPPGASARALPFQQQVRTSWEQRRQGKLIASSADTPLPEPSIELAYLRRAQIADDMFDAYRNLWLAFEAALQRVLPKSGHEKIWLEAALVEADARFEGDFGAVWPEFVDRHYAAYRCALFHASRDGRRAPGRFADVQQVGEALEELAQLTVQLVQRVTGWQSDVGLVVRGGWDHMVDALGGITIGVTDDESDEDPGMTEPAPLSGAFEEVCAEHVKVGRGSFERRFSGRLRVAEMQVGIVHATFQRVADAGSPVLMTWGRTAPLSVEGLSHIEVEHAWHGTHHALARIEYPR